MELMDQRRTHDETVNHGRGVRGDSADVVLARACGQMTMKGKAEDSQDMGKDTRGEMDSMACEDMRVAGVGLEGCIRTVRKGRVQGVVAGRSKAGYVK